MANPIGRLAVADDHAPLADAPSDEEADCFEAAGAWHLAYDATHATYYYYNRHTGASRWAAMPGIAEGDAAGAAGVGGSEADRLSGAMAQDTKCGTRAAFGTSAQGSGVDVPDAAVAETGGWEAGRDAQAAADVDAAPDQQRATPVPGGQAADLAAGQGQQPSTSAGHSAPDGQAAESAWQFLGAGFYYQDAGGVLAGPFTRTQLQGWRAQLPMDLPLFLYDEYGTAAGHALELARLMGEPDSELLDSWRRRNPDLACSYNAAPPAPAYAALVATRGGGACQEYGDAVLAGLPQEDDTVTLAQQAAEAGADLQEVLAFAARCARGGVGGEAAAQGEAQVLYGDMASWCSAGSAYEALQAARERKRRLPRAVVAQLRERRREVKAKFKRQRQGWLYD